MSALRKPDRIILRGGQHEPAIELQKRITEDSHFLYHREVRLLNVLTPTFRNIAALRFLWDIAHRLVLKTLRRLW